MRDQNRNDFIAIGCNLLLQSSANITYYSDSNGAHLVFLIASKTQKQEWVEMGHIFLKLCFQSCTVVRNAITVKIII